MTQTNGGFFQMGDSPKEEWLTPPYILKALGVFDVDPCSPVNRPWATATQHYTILDNGLIQEWRGRVWLNPPYGNQAIRWMQRLNEHGNGIALLLARTETEMFQDCVFGCADALFFIRGRVRFYTVDGKVSSDNPGAPSVLIAYGQNNAHTLRDCSLRGKFVPLIKEQRFEHQPALFTEVNNGAITKLPSIQALQPANGTGRTL